MYSFLGLSIFFELNKSIDWIDILVVITGICSLFVAIVALLYTKKSIKNQMANFEKQMEVQKKQWLDTSVVMQRIEELINLRKKYLFFMEKINEINRFFFGLVTYSTAIDGDKNPKFYINTIQGQPRSFLNNFIKYILDFKQYIENVDFILPVNEKIKEKLFSLVNLYLSFFQQLLSDSSLDNFDKKFILVEKSLNSDMNIYQLIDNKEYRFKFIKKFTQWLPVYKKTDKGFNRTTILNVYGFIGEKVFSDENFEKIANDDTLFADYLRCFISFLVACQKEITDEIFKYVDESYLDEIEKDFNVK